MEEYDTQKKDRDTSRSDSLAGKLIRFISRCVDMVILVILLIMLLFGAYTLYDTHRIYQEAEGTEFETYKPEENGTGNLSFQDLRAINPDVIGWLTVYGTNIDYPLVYSDKFDAYINTDPTGKFTLAGSIFLDYKNDPKFKDFKNIIYGHHMEHSMMFGDIDKFADRGYFDDHKYGNIYYNDKNHGIEFFAYFEGDAYDNGIYDVNLTTDDQKAEFLRYMKRIAMYTRHVSVDTGDTVVLLSTCAGDTNGRYILAGKITDKTYKDPFPAEEQPYLGGGSSFLAKLPFWWWILLGAALLILLGFAMGRGRKRKQRRMKQASKPDEIE